MVACSSFNGVSDLSIGVRYPSYTFPIRTISHWIWRTVYLVVCILLWASWVAQEQRINLQCRRQGFYPWVKKIPWDRKWQRTPVFLPEKCHGQRSLVNYSSWGLKELDMTGHSTHTYTHHTPGDGKIWRAKTIDIIFTIVFITPRPVLVP